VTRLGVTGHRRLRAPELVRQAVRERLLALAPTVTWSMLAAGADQIIAEEALRAGSAISAVLPFRDYESDFSGEELDAYRRLLARCQTVRRLPHVARSDAAYEEAGRIIVDEGDQVLAVWDGQPADGRGGTGDIVAYALSTGRAVERIDPVDGRVEAVQA
jgi:hypothetical protein